MSKYYPSGEAQADLGGVAVSKLTGHSLLQPPRVCSRSACVCAQQECACVCVCMCVSVEPAKQHTPDTHGGRARMHVTTGKQTQEAGATTELLIVGMTWVGMGE